MEINRESLSATVIGLFKNIINETNVFDVQNYNCDNTYEFCSCILSYDNNMGFILNYYTNNYDGTNVKFASKLIKNSDSKSIDDASIIFINNVPKIIFCSTDNQIFGSLITKDDTIMDWKYISVGKNFDVGITYNNDALMIVNDYGYCYNSHDHNTRSYPSVCSSTPIATSTVLDYSVGLINDWIELLESSSSSSSSSSKSPLVTSCSSKILHGSYDQGKLPSIAITYIDNRNVFFSVHEALNDNDKNDNGCGIPISHGKGSILIDSFDIQSWIDKLKEIYND
jgi:hypothetical protein